jgi:hypothetical protein
MRVLTRKFLTSIPISINIYFYMFSYLHHLNKFITFAICILSLNILLAAPPRVDLELIMAEGTGAEDTREWIDMLKDLGFSNLRMRGGRSGDTAEIRQLGTDKNPAYSVTGLVTGGQVLRLPGGNFRLGDKTGVRAWKERLQAGGQEEIQEDKGAFGLTEKQFTDMLDQLKGTITFDTKGETTQTVLKKISREIRLEIVDESKTGDVLKSQEPVLDELHGIAYGTALAAVLRPLGCVYAPERKLGGNTRLVIRASGGEKNWPVGWEVRLSPVKVAPDYFKTTNAEITDFVLSDALNAIQKRINLPLLYDHNNILRQRVEMDKIKVTCKKGRRGYSNILDEILYQAKLKGELRLDEADQPFLWITTLK